MSDDRKEGLKIVRLQAENLKRLVAVEITPDGSLVQITGRNGSGKSSVLDAIYFALAGEKAIDAQPIRKGEPKARVTLDLGEITVTRRFTEKGTSLVVEAENGARFPSPQRLLDDLLGELTFDPLEFSRMKPGVQAEVLRELVGLNTREFDDRASAAYDARTVVNRNVKSLTERLSALDREIDPKATVEPMDVSALLAQMDDAARQQMAIEKERFAREQQDQRAEVLRVYITATEQKLRAAEHELDEINRSVNGREALPEATDTASIRAQVEEAQRTNMQRQRQRDLRETAGRIMKELEAASAQSENLTIAIEQAKEEKARAIAAANFPVPGLSIGDDGAALYNDIPFEQASSAEQLRVSVAIAMAANPKLRVLRVKDGSLLDEDSLKLIAETVEANGYQLWLERVDATGKVGIQMEDGAVVAINGEPVEQDIPEPATAG